MTTPNEELHTLLANAAKACGYRYHAESGTILNSKHNVQEWQPQLPGLDSQVLSAELGDRYAVVARWLFCMLKGPVLARSELR